MKSRPKSGSTISRRRFVALMAAGSAAVVARPASAAPPAAGSAPPPAPAMTPAQQKEYDRQVQSTLDTLKTIRSHAMPPGTELAFVFKPLGPSAKGR